MPKVIALYNQSLFDLSVQLTGVAFNALEIALVNNINPTDQLVPGQDYEVPAAVVSDEDVLRYYQANSLFPASSLTTEVIQDIIGCEGIGCWAIGIDFKVS